MRSSFKRWYDIDEQLSIVVHTMEKLTFVSQLTFANTLLDLSERILMEKGRDEYLANLDEERQKGLEKSIDKRRWYDRYPTLHKAFNNLYALRDEDRHEIADILLVPCQIVQLYEQYCERRNRETDPKVIQEILRTSIVEGPNRAKRLYSIYTSEAV